MITILLPLKHYHPVFLAEAVACVFAQTDPSWQLLVIVEAEDVSSFRGLLAAALTDPRVSLVVNEGRGLAGTFNTGMRQARTPFVAILLGDDLWSSDAVAVLRRHIDAHPDVDFFHSSRAFIDESGARISSVYPSREAFTLADFQWTSPVKHLLCWRREPALAAGGMDESLPNVGPDDYDFPWTMAEAGLVFRAVPECLYLVRDHREGFRLTTHLPLDVHKAGIRRILEKHGVAEEIIARRLDASGRTYLRQCLYDSIDDQAAKQAAGLDPRDGWREPYQ